MIEKLVYIIFIFQIVLSLSVFDLKILNNYGDHHMIFLFSATSSVYVVIHVILMFISYGIRYKIYLLRKKTSIQMQKNDLKNHSARRVLEHKKLTTECRALTQSF